MIQYGMMYICLFLRVCKSLSGGSENVFEHPAGASEQTAGFGGKTSEHPNTDKTKKIGKSPSYDLFCAQHPNKKGQKRARTRAECITIPKRAHPNTPLTARTIRHVKLKAREISVRLGTARKTSEGVLRCTLRTDFRVVTTYHAIWRDFLPSYYYLRNLIVYGCR